MKSCTCCKELKPVEAFSKNNRKTDGLASWCRTCTAAINRVCYAKRMARDGERQKVRDKANARNRANPAKRRLEYKQFAKNNLPYVLARNAAVKAAKKHRTPAWLSKDDFWLITQAYDIAALRTKVLGFPWHVDHILPLQGRLVSGLHVPNNLQVIPAAENWHKSNSFTTS